MNLLLCVLLQKKEPLCGEIIRTQEIMEVTQFYLHLPSNSSLDKFPQNTLTENRVSLPQTITLEGEWEVALTEIHYPHS